MGEHISHHSSPEMSVDRLINILIALGHGANVILEKSYSRDSSHSSCAKFPLSFAHKKSFQIMLLFMVASELSALQLSVFNTMYSMQNV